MIWLLGAIIAAIIADKKQIGSGWAFFISLIFSPVVGIIVALASSKKVPFANQFMAQQTFVNNSSPKNRTVADEILQYKSLLDQGIITAEEYEAKKKQLLDIK